MRSPSQIPMLPNVQPAYKRLNAFPSHLMLGVTCGRPYPPVILTNPFSIRQSPHYSRGWGNTLQTLSRSRFLKVGPHEQEGDREEIPMFCRLVSCALLLPARALKSCENSAQPAPSPLILQLLAKIPLPKYHRGSKPCKTTLLAKF